MTKVYPQDSLPLWDKLQRPEVDLVTDDAVLVYLRRTFKIAEISALAEQEAIIIKACEAAGLNISDEELQAAGDTFRMENKLLGASKTLDWLTDQRISSEEWTDGIRVKLLTNKLRKHLFEDMVDAHYLNYRNDYRRAAFSQILVSELPEALQIIQDLRSEKASFCAMALEHSKAQSSAKQGGFVGVRFISTLMPEIKERIENHSEGSITEPIKTHLGYHILRIEKWLEPQLTEVMREEIIDTLFQTWLTSNQAL